MSQITKNALMQAFLDTLDQKPLSKITVSDITDTAGVNRHTFYYHFKDINDMITWSFAVKANDILKDKVNYKNWQEGFKCILDYFVDRKKYLLAVYHSQSKESLLVFLSNWTHDMIEQVLSEQSNTMHVQKRDKDFIVDFYTCGFIGIFNKWLECGMVEDPDYIARQVGILLEGASKEALVRFENETLSVRH